MGMGLLTVVTLFAVPAFAIAYARGCKGHGRGWRDYAFAAGLIIALASSTWPLEHLARHHFDLHQAMFLGLRIAGPMLIALSHPAGTLLRGTPRGLRGGLIAPALRNRTVREGWRLVRMPATALGLYLGTLFAWSVPAWQDAALLMPAIALLLHLSMFLAGMVFWTRIFDRRPAPHGLRHGVRLMMLWLAILGQILVGSATTLKSVPWYPGYAAVPVPMLDLMRDEMVGGFLLWIPSSLVTLLGLIAVVDMWGRHETRMDARRTAWSPSNSAILLYPTSSEGLRTMAQPKNRVLALSMALFALFILSATLLVGLGYRYL